jgi:uncharacterized tellurite resistance protein B-like protein
MEQAAVLLEGSSDVEKGAYIGAIASLATADREATTEEVEYLTALSDAAQLSPQQKEAVLQAAKSITAEDVTRCLDVLKKSELKYSFITDLIAFAKADEEYSEAEQQQIHKMAAYLGVEEKQLSLLDNFTEEATSTNTTAEQVSSRDFLSSTGLKEKMASAGINGDMLLKGLLGIAGPILLSRMLGGRSRGGMLGGGGIFGGSGGFGGIGGGMLGGGLGSIIGMLGGRGMGSMGGILGSIFGGRRGI